MKTLSIFLSTIFLSSISYSQVNGDVAVWEFYRQLETEATKPCGNSCDSLDRLAFEQRFFKSDTARIAIDTAAHYQLLFHYEYGWTDVLGNQDYYHDIFVASEPIKLTDPKKKENKSAAEIKTITFIEAPKKDQRHFPKNGKIYSGSELFQKLKIKNSLLNSTDPIQSYPVVYERDDTLNCEWLPVSSCDYLVLRYAHSYPNGNVTSFYNESILYFRKME
jgi:hypothetical protein